MTAPRPLRSVTGLWLAAGLLLGCAGAPSEESPGSAVRAFYDRLNEGDHAGAATLYSAEVQAVFADAEDAMEAFEVWAKGETKSGSVAQVRIVSSAESAGTADVQFEVGYRDGSTVTRHVRLVQENGSWRLGFVEP